LRHGDVEKRLRRGEVHGSVEMVIATPAVATPRRATLPPCFGGTWDRMRDFQAAAWVGWADDLKPNPAGERRCR
jgi:hypothetical protein